MYFCGNYLQFMETNQLQDLKKKLKKIDNFWAENILKEMQKSNINPPLTKDRLYRIINGTGSRNAGLQVLFCKKALEIIEKHETELKNLNL